MNKKCSSVAGFNPQGACAYQNMDGTAFNGHKPISWAGWDGASENYGCGTHNCFKCMKLTTACSKIGSFPIKMDSAYVTIIDSMEPANPKDTSDNNVDLGSELYKWFTNGEDPGALCFDYEIVDAKFCDTTASTSCCDNKSCCDKTAS